jgi:spore coat protein H
MFQKLSMSSYDFFIHPQYHAEFAKGIWRDNPIPAILTYQRKKHPMSITYRGSYTRKMRKRSYSLFLNEPVHHEHIDTIHLNAEYNDPSLMRNKLALDFFASLGILSPSSSYADIRINRKQKGVYLQLESVDKHFLQNRHLPNGSLYYAINQHANFSLHKNKHRLLDGYVRKYGDEKADHDLINFLHTIHTTAQEFEQQIPSILHIEDYLRWLVGIVCTQNADGFTHNYALYRNEDSKLISIIPWDYDATWGRKYNGNPLAHDYISIHGQNILTEKLLNISAFRKRYYTLLKDTLNETFTTSFLRPQIEQISDVIYPFIRRDPLIKYTTHLFDEEIEHILTFIRKRNAFLASALTVSQ